MIDRCLAQAPATYVGEIPVSVGADSAKCTHEFTDYCHWAEMRLSSATS